MSREERIFSQVGRLLNEDDEKGNFQSNTSGHATTQDASMDGSEGKTGSQSYMSQQSGHDGHQNQFNRLQDNESEVVYNQHHQLGANGADFNGFH